MLRGKKPIDQIVSHDLCSHTTISQTFDLDQPHFWSPDLWTLNICCTNSYSQQEQTFWLLTTPVNFSLGPWPGQPWCNCSVFHPVYCCLWNSGPLSNEYSVLSAFLLLKSSIRLRWFSVGIHQSDAPDWQWCKQNQVAVITWRIGACAFPISATTIIHSVLACSRSGVLHNSLTACTCTYK